MTLFDFPTFVPLKSKDIVLTEYAICVMICLGTKPDGEEYSDKELEVLNTWKELYTKIDGSITPTTREYVNAFLDGTTPMQMAQSTIVD